MPTRELIRSLIRHEGMGPVINGRTYRYQDSRGFWSVGCGRCVSTNQFSDHETAMTGWNGGSITVKGAYWLLEHDASDCERDLMKALPWVSKLDPARRDCLFEMAYQLGVGGLLKFKTTLRLVRAGAYGMAASAMLRSLWAKQTPGRVREMEAQMRTGAYP